MIRKPRPPLACLFAVAALVLTACVAGPSGRSADAPPLAAVESVDLERYAGLWYEIARYPNSFQSDCEGVTAEYTPLDDGGIKVVNTCRFGTEDGAPRAAETTAQIMPGSNGARLFVNFAPVPLPRGRGNYWVIHIDPDYTHALVGEPSGRFLWMLARTPEITPEARATLNGAALEAGYTLALLKETDQTPPPATTPAAP
ncbi:MAG: lipocalin family protein [Pseudomonadota bacterium]